MAIERKNKHMKNRVIIITGGASGLGYATAEELASKGANITLVDYNKEALEASKKQIEQKYPGVKLLTVVADVSNQQQVKNYVDETMKAFGRIDGLYNNAGIEGKQAPMIDYDVDIFKKVIDINVLGVYYGMRYVIPVMQKQGFGRIVNVSSVGGIRGVVNQTAYVASKHAVTGMTKNAAIEYGKDGILTNAIAPGAILTPMVETAFKEVNPDDPKAAEHEYASRNPTRALGKPVDVAKAVAFLISEENGYISGQTIAIDGGESRLYGNA
eukprot:Anaeramoba_flamelloidesa1065889_107.p1 GENE.a1065889_107~~a1065889_107.p1  ORF type:complete len:270 (+),score=23.74 a1065889_107:331-1140(+)